MFSLVASLGVHCLLLTSTMAESSQNEWRSHLGPIFCFAEHVCGFLLKISQTAEVETDFTITYVRWSRVVFRARK